MRPNREAGPCSVCQVDVVAEAGVWVGRGDEGRVLCSAHLPQPPPRGDHPGWHLDPIASLDFETTGVDPWTDRVISFAALGDRGAAITGLINPGIPVPPLSAEVHGITDDVLASAPPPATGLTVVVEWVQSLINRSVPLVVFNAPYDLTLLKAEAARWGLAQPDWDRLLVIDPYVVDFGIEGDTLGSRRLIDVAAFYGVAIDDAHDAACDAEAARGVAIEMAARQPALASMSMPMLMQEQRQWFASRVESWNRRAAERLIADPDAMPRRDDDPHGWPFGLVQVVSAQA